MSSESETGVVIPQFGTRGKVWIGLPVLTILIGMGAWIYQLTQGLAVTGMDNVFSWGLYIMLFVLFIGLSAGGLIISSAPKFFHSKRYDSLAIDDLWDRATLDVTEIEPGPHTIAGFDITAVETDHSEYCLAYRFGDRFVFSGDTEASPAVARLADGCEVLLHDCAYRDSHPDPSNHPTPTSLGRALRDEGVEIDELYLTHLYPDAAGAVDELRATVASYIDVPVHVPSDTDVLLS